jgi:hypothetical protein
MEQEKLKKQSITASDPTTTITSTRQRDTVTTTASHTVTTSHVAAVVAIAAKRINNNKQPALDDVKDNDQFEVFLYRIKKSQYLFYKHGVLHGINISVVLNANAIHEIPYHLSWRIFWILLNTSYVMEFFLQTLVKRNVMGQVTMLWFQRFLVTTASMGAIIIFKYVSIWIMGVSLLLNFIHRHHDVMNTMGVAIVGIAIKELNS